MSTMAYGIIEIVLFFGGILAFCLYQLHCLRKSRENGGTDDDPAVAPNKKSGEDIFWDTLAKKR